MADRANHKYQSKRFVNGHWVYEYSNPTSGSSFRPSNPEAVEPKTKRNPVAAPTKIGALKNRATRLVRRINNKYKAAKNKLKSIADKGSAAYKKALAKVKDYAAKKKKARQLGKTLKSELAAKAEKRGKSVYGETHDVVPNPGVKIKKVGKYTVKQVRPVRRQKTQGSTYSRSNLKD